MSFVYKNLEAFARGDDWTVRFSFTDENNNPIDITGNTYWMTLKVNKDDPDPGVAQVAFVASGANALAGIIFMSFESAVTNTLTPGTYHYDLQEVDSVDNVYTLLIGKVKVVKDITRSTTV